MKNAEIITTRPLADRPVKIAWDKRETPPNAEEVEEDSVLLLALSVMLDGVDPSMSQESQLSEF